MIASLTETLGEETPEFIIRNADIYIVQDQKFRLLVDSLTYYNEKQEYHAEGVEFYGYSIQGDELFEAQSGSAILFESTNDIELLEDVTLSVEEDGITIQGESFSWKDAIGEFSADPDSEIVITKTDGSNFKGKGFVVNEYTREIQFSSSASGVIASQQASEEEDSAEQDSEGQDPEEQGSEEGSTQ